MKFAPLRHLLAAAALTLTALPAGAQKVETCSAVSEDQIAALFDRWNGSLATGKPEVVTANYAADAVLLATVSNTPRTTPALINDYFVHFLEKKPRGRIDSRTVRIGCNTASDVGTYTFTLTDPKSGKVADVAARYSFLYERRGDQWLIVHHHSSAMPEKPAAAHAAKDTFNDK